MDVGAENWFDRRFNFMFCKKNYILLRFFEGSLTGNAITDTGMLDSFHLIQNSLVISARNTVLGKYINL